MRAIVVAALIGFPGLGVAEALAAGPSPAGVSSGAASTPQQVARRAKSSWIERRPGGVEIDWTAGAVTVRAAAAADLRAPRADVARVGAERSARKVAARRLDEVVRTLPITKGRGRTTVGRALDADVALASRLEAALARAKTIDLVYASDGSTQLGLTLPLDEVLAAVTQPAPAHTSPAATGAPAGDASNVPTAIVVDASRLALKPVLDLELIAGDVRVEGGDTYWLPSLGAATRDPRAGARPLRARALGVRGGALRVAAEPEALARARAADVPVLVVTHRRPGGRR